MSGKHRTEIAGDSDAANRTSFENLGSELLASSFVSGTQMAKVLSENRKLRQNLEEIKKEVQTGLQLSLKFLPFGGVFPSWCFG